MTMRGMPVTTASSCNSCLLAVNLVFWSQTLTAYSLLLFLLVLEVQCQCKNYKVYFGRSKYVFEQCCMKTRLTGNEENNSQRG